jgi:5-carboxymethyl-2-hydroxymuconate isomerase
MLASFMFSASSIPARFSRNTEWSKANRTETENFVFYISLNINLLFGKTQPVYTRRK